RLSGGRIRFRRQSSGIDAVPLPSAAAHGFWLHVPVQLRMTSKIAHSTANASAEMTSDEAAAASRHSVSPLEVLRVFVRLGMSCFGARCPPRSLWCYLLMVQVS